MTATAPAAHGSSMRVLYVREHIREHATRRFGDARHWGYTEEEALRFVLSSLDALDCAVDRIVARPHPSEATVKYAWAAGESPVPLVIGGRAPLVQEMADCDLVVGCNSMATVIGLLTGRRALSCVPPGGTGYAVPQREIELLQAALRQRDSVGAP